MIANGTTNEIISQLCFRIIVLPYRFASADAARQPVAEHNRLSRNIKP
jgi:hypothetical protein